MFSIFLKSLILSSFFLSITVKFTYLTGLTVHFLYYITMLHLKKPLIFIIVGDLVKVEGVSQILTSFRSKAKRTFISETKSVMVRGNSSKTLRLKNFNDDTV